MVDLGTLATYVAVVLGLMLIPGPAVLLVLARATTGGRRIGVATGLGIATGDLVHTLMATFGLSVILATSALAFSIVKYLGVGYLFYLGIRAFLEKSTSPDLPAAQAIGAARAFRQAVVTEMLNPKTALFFLAFLPQFVHPERGSGIAQFAELGFVFVVLSVAYTVMIAAIAGSFGRWLVGHPEIGRWQGKVIGAIYISLGLRLALQER
ncbi:LysE family translocator [Rhizobium ruizarguesonis]|uniref:LysE family translocator n=1 Tax=Rhizobium ruizarguesonis TaxID=2081791 RepID=A0AB38HTX3_9HYPH|nr:LysE family translocator [Rhizobium ruizarguesonis]NKK55151.1 LysE family translocator [Rhizobium leguminosarum bv. viciae]NEI06725.1 LysE family transporter [Rhizobium ruizarguesonis]NEI27108.1 LysE family transporter [Rhizobium ruizarguesonis]TAT92463.1 LysE family translocator [Rhizobium ruizarguesonis]TAZ25750.1 LysE family translocator [Rhizobium ruizarguesonis]